MLQHAIDRLWAYWQLTYLGRELLSVASWPFTVSLTGTEVVFLPEGLMLALPALAECPSRQTQCRLVANSDILTRTYNTGECPARTETVGDDNFQSTLLQWRQHPAIANSPDDGGFGDETPKTLTKDIQ